MAGMNLVFHIVSALVFAALIYKIIVLLRQQRLGGLLWAYASGSRQQAVKLIRPDVFLRDLSQVWQLELAGASPRLQVARIDMQPWLEVHSKGGLHTLEWTDQHAINIVLNRDPGRSLSEWNDSLKKSLGGGVDVHIKITEQGGTRT